MIIAHNTRTVFLALIAIGCTLSVGCAQTPAAHDAGTIDSVLISLDAPAPDAVSEARDQEPIVDSSETTDAVATDTPSIDAAVIDATATDATVIDSARADATVTDATVSDSASTDATPTDAPAWSAATLAYLARIAALRTGGPVDLDGDGTAEGTLTVAPDGTRTVVRRAGGLDVFHQIEHPTNAVESTEDQDGDGSPDVRYTRTVTGSVVREVEEFDTDLDGSFDRREIVVTRNIGTPTQLVTYSVETLDTSPDAGGRFVEQSSYSSEGIEQQCPDGGGGDSGGGDGGGGGLPLGDAGDGGDAAPDAGGDAGVCDPFVGVPARFEDVRATSEPTPYARIRIATSGPVGCTEDQRIMISIALDGAIADMHATLSAIHADREYIVAEGLANRDWLIGCGIHNCPRNASAVALTDPAPRAGYAFLVTSIGASPFTHGVYSVEEIVLHEMMHMVGLHHIGGFDGDRERDYIYACSRHANQCRAFNEGFRLAARVDMESGRDAARCADMHHKRDFGVARRVVRSTHCVSETSPGVEIAGGGAYECIRGTTPTGPCTSCLRSTTLYCDRTPVPIPDRRAHGEMDYVPCCLACGNACDMNLLYCPTLPPIYDPDMFIGCHFIAGCGY